MSILTPTPSIRDAPFSITFAEHPRHLVKRFTPPGRVVWFTIRPERHVRFEVLHGFKTQGSVVVTFHF